MAISTIRITYTGAQASCIITGDSTAKTISSKIGAAGAEAPDAAFGAAGTIDLSAAAYDTPAELQAEIDGYTDYSCEIVSGPTGTIDTTRDTEIQAKAIWAYVLLDLQSVLDEENALITWAYAKELAGYKDDLRTTVERLINIVSKTANRVTGRKLKARAYSRTFDGSGDSTLIFPEAPVNVLTELYLDTDRVFGSDTEITADKYDLEEDTGILRLYDTIFTARIACVKGLYNAGYGYLSAEIPEDMQYAALEILVWNMKRLTGGIGIRSESADGVNVGMEIMIPLNAKAVLESYARRLF